MPPIALACGFAQAADIVDKVQDGKVHVDDASVVQADVVADNGVIHVIDTVLLPK